MNTLSHRLLLGIVLAVCVSGAAFPEDSSTRPVTFSIPGDGWFVVDVPFDWHERHQTAEGGSWLSVVFYPNDTLRLEISAGPLSADIGEANEWARIGTEHKPVWWYPDREMTELPFEKIAIDTLRGYYFTLDYPLDSDQPHSRMTKGSAYIENTGFTFFVVVTPDDNTFRKQAIEVFKTLRLVEE